MSRLLDFITARLRRFVGDRRRFPRYKARRRVRLIFNLSPSETQAGASDDHRLTFAGYTSNFSETGLAIFVPSLRAAGYDFDAVGRDLRAELELPTGMVNLRATVVRSERVEKGGDEEKGYLLGLRITEMSDSQWVLLVRYVQTLR